MPSFKELMQSFLYEDVEDDDEDEDDYIEPVRKQEPVKTQPAVSASQPAAAAAAAAAPAPSAQDMLMAAHASNISAEPVQSAQSEGRTSIFSGLDMEDISRPESEPETKSRASAYHYDRRKMSKPVRRNQPDFEYEAVISPIFGNMHDDEKEFEAIHDAVNLPRPTEELEMTSVISPMFGSGQTAGKSEDQPVDHIPEYQPKPRLNKKKKAAPTRDDKKPQAAYPANTNSAPAAKPIRDVTDLLTRETVSAPAEKKPETESEQLSLESDQ